MDGDDIGSVGVRTILGSGSDGSYQIMQGLEARIETPLSFDHSATARGGARRPTGDFNTPKESEDDDGFFVKQTGGGRDGSRQATKRVSAHGLYGPHESGTGICGGIVARGAQGRFPDRFCLKTRCGFTSHSSKNYLSKLQRGTFYVKENESYGYCNLSLSAEAATLAPEGLLAGLNNVPGWKAIIRQLEDQLAAGPTTQQATADRAEGLLGFADRMLQAPYAPTPMRPIRRRQHDALEEDGEDGKEGGGSRNNEGMLPSFSALKIASAICTARWGFGHLTRDTSPSTVGW